MTEANRYTDAAKRILPEIVSWPTGDDVTSVSACWGDDPGLSSSKCAHFAYDWFYDALNGGAKQIVFKMCEDRARQTYRYLTNPDSCHDGRLTSPSTDKAISMASESEGAKTWFEILPRSYDYLLPALSRL